MACFKCEVRKECDEFRERTGSEYGVWAGRLQKRKPAPGEPDEDDD